jgi:small subunit ribosomal protein S1
MDQRGGSLSGGTRRTGKVVNLTDYGAFVELEPGLEGLIHVSEMSWTRRVAHPSKVLEVGQEVDVQVLGIDAANRRVSLGLEAGRAEPRGRRCASTPDRQPHPRHGEEHHGLRSLRRARRGIDGLVHVSDLHWTKRVKHPSELYNKGDEVEAVVLGIDVNNERISLGIKQLAEDPWARVPRAYPVGTRVRGKVTSVTDFGVFVEIEEGVEGLIHVSQLSTERVDRPASLHSVGDEVEAEVTQVDAREKRIGLSIKALRRTEEREEVDAYLRRERDEARFSFADVLSAEGLPVGDKDKR